MYNASEQGEERTWLKKSGCIKIVFIQFYRSFNLFVNQFELLCRTYFKFIGCFLFCDQQHSFELFEIYQAVAVYTENL